MTPKNETASQHDEAMSPSIKLLWQRMVWRKLVGLTAVNELGRRTYAPSCLLRCRSLGLEYHHSTAPAPPILTTEGLEVICLCFRPQSWNLLNVRGFQLECCRTQKRIELWHLRSVTNVWSAIQYNSKVLGRLYSFNNLRPHIFAHHYD